MFFIVDLLLEKSGIYLREVQFELETQLGLAVSAGCLCKFLHKFGFTHQHLSKYAIQRSDCLRARFAQNVSLYSPDMMIFLDETAPDRRGALQGKPA